MKQERMKEINEIVRQILKARGIVSDEDIAEYMSVRPQRTYDPFLMKGMEEAVSIIADAAEKKQRVCIYGDYDCDGVTSVTLLLYAFSKFMDEERISYFIPSRFKDGYGLNRKAVKEIADMGTDLLITVDCGCSSVDEVAYAKELGMEVIVTDHHIVPAERPDCVMLDPKQEGCGYPYKGLAGCGVAYKLVQALQRTLGLERSVVADTLDIVGIATIGDIVPLTDENRTLAKYGIDRIRNTKRPGLKALLGAISIDRRTIGSTGVAFGIVPNINANGRMKSADLGVRLLSCQDEKEAFSLARETASNNAMRKKLQDDAFKECMKLAGEQCPDSLFPIVRADVHEGVAGIVAGKLKEELARPSVIVTGEGGRLKGTGRSVEGIDLHAVLSKCSDLFEKFGGHQGACGFSMDEAGLEELRRRAEAETAKIVEKDPDVISGRIRYDMEIDAGDITLELADELAMMEPFGKDNEQPVFMVRGVRAGDGRLIGNGTHIRFSIGEYPCSIGCICFGKAEEYKDMIFGREMIDVVGTIEINEWNGRRSVQMNVKSIGESAVR